MSNLLQELGTHGVLLLYLADELSLEDRVGVERRLLSDPAMRGELDSLREAQALLDARFATMDAAAPLAAEEAAAVRNVSGALRHWQARPRLASSAGATDGGRRGLPRWAYRGAIAAAIAVVAGATWRTLVPRARDNVAVERTTPAAVEQYAQQLDPWEAEVVQALSTEVADAPLGEGHEVASAGYDQPLFDIPFSVPPEGGSVEP